MSSWPEENVLVVRIIGGLGNQLYQYGAGVALAQTTGRQLWLDRSADPALREEHPRPFLLESLGVPEPIFCPKGARRVAWKLLLKPDLTNKLSILAKILKVGVISDSASFEDTAVKIRKTQGAVALYGYFIDRWAAEAAVGKVRPLLRKFKLGGSGEAMLHQIASSPNPVAIHVRRGDYLKIASAPVLSEQYYREGVDQIRRLVPDADLFVFSDDREWATQWANEIGAFAVTDHCEADATADLSLISSCRHFVLSDSTFSAWGLRFAQTDDQSVVITPNGFASKYGFSETIPGGA